MDQAKVVLGVGALVLAIGGGLFAGRVSSERAASNEREAIARARRAAAEQSEAAATAAAAAAAQRRASRLQRFTMLRSVRGAVPGIGVCASEELTNCEVRYGNQTRTLVWRVPRIIPPETCENFVVNAGVACADVATDGSVAQFAACFMEHGWMPAEADAFTILDLREPQLAPNHAMIQCDQGRYASEFDPSP